MGDYKSIYEKLKGSYGEGIPSNVSIDKSLSSKRVKVYKSNNDAKAYVVHRGTSNLKDWATDFKMLLGYEGGNRFKHSKKVQRKAEKKYGADNITTMGHSLGGRLAEKYGKNSSQIITYNKAATPRSIIESIIKPIQSKQTDIRTKNDIVSIGSVLQKRRKKQITLHSQSSNPIIAHNLEQLKK